MFLIRSGNELLHHKLYKYMTFIPFYQHNTHTHVAHTYIHAIHTCTYRRRQNYKTYSYPHQVDRKREDGGGNGEPRRGNSAERWFRDDTLAYPSFSVGVCLPTTWCKQFFNTLSLLSQDLV